MDIKERLWAKTLLTAYPYLVRAAEEADARLADEAVSSWRSPLSAEDTCKRLMRIVAAKEGYINARVITNECVARLPQKLGRALKCRYFEMLSYPVIARVAGVSERSVYNHMQRAEEAFAGALVSRGYGVERLEELFGDNVFLKGVYNRLF